MSTKASGKSAKEDLYKALEKLVNISNDGKLIIQASKS